MKMILNDTEKIDACFTMPLDLSQSLTMPPRLDQNMLSGSWEMAVPNMGFKFPFLEALCSASMLFCI